MINKNRQEMMLESELPELCKGEFTRRLYLLHDNNVTMDDEMVDAS